MINNSTVNAINTSNFSDLGIHGTNTTFDDLVIKMQQLSDSIALPKYYKDDIALDFKILKKYGLGKKYVWLLRESGCLLFPLEIGANTHFIDMYMKGDKTARYFLVDTSKDDLVEITPNEVTPLINKAPINVHSYDTAISLINAIERVLSDVNVTSKTFMKADMGTTPIFWQEWVKWFEGENDIMHTLMFNSINKLNTLTNH
ncbi:hypothetical protein CIK00_02700 [Photobacterium carnosum]|uniref:Uncharacterized protein n=2 Tax=Vibrionaceae TaxID=641 RepID=A0A2N4UVZ6_9GAMM|nr:hypothetical protein CIK00_02700 [Photobacterium carnosum]